MIKKEWLEVCKQSLYAVLAMAGMVLLMALMNLLQGKPQFKGETIIIILGFWLLLVSMFLGLSPFAMDSKQKGMEYLLTLPYSRRRLLFIKLLPRLVAAILFYGAFFFLYRLIGSDAFGGYFAFFILSYFALFFISFSFSIVHENFIVQSIWAGIALIGYLAICLFILAWGFARSNNLSLGSIWRFNSLGDLAFDSSSLITAIAVFLLMLAPFVASNFLAFKKFDLRSARAFNRRQLLFFVPLLLLALGVSLGITYWVQKSSAYDESDFYVMKNQRLLKTSWPGKLTVHDQNGIKKIDTRKAVFWNRVLLEKGQQLFLLGYDTQGDSDIIICLDMNDLSWKELYRVRHSYLASHTYFSFNYDGTGFVYLRRSRAEVERRGGSNLYTRKSDVLELVSLDPANSQSRSITYMSPFFQKYYEPQIFGCGKLNDLRFWLIAHRWSSVLRLWEDGRVEDLGLSKGLPAYVGGLLFTRGDNSLQVRQLLGTGSKTIKEINGDFSLRSNYHFLPVNNGIGEIYAEQGTRIVRLNLATMAVDDVGPVRGLITLVTSGDFYYVEFENWPHRDQAQLLDHWRKIYRLQDGKMVFLKQIDFSEPGWGHVWVDTSGVYLRQEHTTRIFAFPDLKELKFKD